MTPRKTRQQARAALRGLKKRSGKVSLLGENTVQVLACSECR